jgi:murein DD-endopeptidase MepM/ murein hydrolase activator NlpD
MAVEADSVVVSIIGDTSKLDEPVGQSATNFDRSMSTIEKSASRAEAAVKQSAASRATAEEDAAKRTLAAQRAAFVKLSEARQAVVAGVNRGEDPVQALTLQLPKIAQALSLIDGPADKAGESLSDAGGDAKEMSGALLDGVKDSGLLTGKLAGLASVLSGPFGAAIGAAIGFFASYIASTISATDETDELVDKLRKEAAQSELTRQAKERFGKTTEGVTKAIRDQQAALDDLHESEKTDAQRLNEATKRSLERIRNIRNETAASLDQAIAELEVQRVRAQAPGQRGENASLGLEAASGRVEALRNKLAANRKSIADAERAYNESRAHIGIEQANRAAEAAATAEGRIQSQYEAQKKALQDRYETEIKVTKEQGKQVALSNQLGASLKKLAQDRDAALKRAQEDKRAPKATDADTTPFLRPVDGGRVTGRFGEKRGGRLHQGTDIAVPVGASVSAAAGGTIIESGTLPGYGNVIIIDHGRGTTTRYAHLSKLLAGKGDVVDAGQVIGLSGGAKGAPGSGNSQGPHLHYEVRRGGRPVDPSAGAFPIDPATARRSNEKVRDDFNKLMDDLQGDADRARERITQSFTALEDSLDPAAKSARELADQIQTIENARLIGLISDSRALELRLAAVRKQIEPVVKKLEAIGRGTAKRVEAGQKEASDQAREHAENQIYQLADLYESLFTGGTKNLWEEFKRQGLRALAILAAQKTFELITGKKAPGGAGGDGIGDAIGSIIGAIGSVLRDGSGSSGTKAKLGSYKAGLGRASGGYVGPHSIHPVNESSGGVELLRMGPQGGEIIPLGQTKAATPAAGGVTLQQTINIDSRGSVNPAGYTEHIKAAVRQETIQIVAKASRATLNAVPGRLASFQTDGT